MAAEAAAVASAEPVEPAEATTEEEEDEGVEEDDEEQHVSPTASLPRSIEGNFEHYGMRAPSLVCADAAALFEIDAADDAADGTGAPPSTRSEHGGVGFGTEAALLRSRLFDAVVTDPPYGKREFQGGRMEGDTQVDMYGDAPMYKVCDTVNPKSGVTSEPKRIHVHSRRVLSVEFY